MIRTRWTAALLVGLILAAPVCADVDADPNKDYVVVPEAGPWMVCATCYVGPQAVDLAHQFVLEIRGRFHLPAYYFDKTAKDKREQREYIERMHQQFPGSEHHVRITRIEDQVVVLVGGYKDFDTASAAMKHIKKLPPPSDKRLMPFLHEVSAAEGQQGAVVKGTFVNPFLSSFVAHNPTVPLEKPVENKAEIYKWYKKLNSGEAFSLLKCSKPWTLVVANYQGLQAYQTKQSDEGWLKKLFDDDHGTKLEASAYNAHNFAEALRRAKFEAYVLHTRYGSVVTIGGYDRADDPRMASVRSELANCRLDGRIAMMAQPMPMEVPRP